MMVDLMDWLLVGLLVGEGWISQMGGLTSGNGSDRLLFVTEDGGGFELVDEDRDRFRGDASCCWSEIVSSLLLGIDLTELEWFILD